MTPMTPGSDGLRFTAEPESRRQDDAPLRMARVFACGASQRTGTRVTGMCDPRRNTYVTSIASSTENRYIALHVQQTIRSDLNTSLACNTAGARASRGRRGAHAEQPRRDCRPPLDAPARLSYDTAPRQRQDHP